jgi:hypothetical protein
MAVAFVNTNTPFEAGASVGTLSGAQTVDGGADCAVVCVQWETSGEADVAISSITYGGQAMTSVGNRLSNAGELSQVFRLIAPPTGSNTLEVVFASAGQMLGSAAVLSAYSGVDQATPIRAGSITEFNGVADGGGNASVVVPSAVGDMTSTGMGTTCRNEVTNQTLRAALTVGNTFLRTDDAPGATTVTHTWFTDLDPGLRVTITGFSLQQVSATPPTIPARAIVGNLRW